MNDTSHETQAPAPKTLFNASLIAFGVALVILFAVILPAEFEYDPLGIGGLLGIRGLSAGNAPALEEQLSPHRTDYVEFYLEPFQSVEYKYMMEIDAPLVFTWEADGELYFDMHAHQPELDEETAESYELGTAQAKTGSYHAAFTGLHGWFWENRSSRDIEVRLYASGFFINSTVYSGSVQYDRDIEPVAEVIIPTP